MWLCRVAFFLFCYTIRELTTTSSALHLIQMTYDHSCFVIGTSKKTTYLNVSFIASTINITDFYYFSPDEYLPDIIKYTSVSSSLTSTFVCSTIGYHIAGGLQCLPYYNVVKLQPFGVPISHQHYQPSTNRLSHSFSLRE